MSLVPPRHPECLLSVSLFSTCSNWSKANLQKSGSWDTLPTSEWANHLWSLSLVISVNCEPILERTSGISSLTALPSPSCTNGSRSFPSKSQWPTSKSLLSSGKTRQYRDQQVLDWQRRGRPINNRMMPIRTTETMDQDLKMVIDPLPRRLRTERPPNHLPLDQASIDLPHLPHLPLSDLLLQLWMLLPAHMVLSMVELVPMLSAILIPMTKGLNR
jgi:hypothetical protein